MASTARNMWKVIHDRKCGAIVMLSDLVENGMASKCMYLFHNAVLFVVVFYNNHKVIFHVLLSLVAITAESNVHHTNCSLSIFVYIIVGVLIL